MRGSRCDSAHAQHVEYFNYLTYNKRYLKRSTVAPDKVWATLLLDAWAIFT